jgi:nucleoside-diphosphate-sugar epimerase
METMENYYRDKKVVVCGGAGFVGGYLVEQLVSMGAKVTVLDDLSRGVRVHPETDFATVDVSDVDECVYFFDGAFAVFNLAAQVAGVLHNENHHLSMYKGNVDLLTAPTIAADICGVPNFLQVSSVCIYSPDNNHPSKEEYGMTGAPHHANAGYSEAKRDGERLMD